MRPNKRRRIGLLANRETVVDGANESEPETRATVVEEGDVIKVTFGGDTEDELEDELDEDEEVGGHHTPMEASPLTTRVLLRYYNNLTIIYQKFYLGHTILKQLYE